MLSGVNLTVETKGTIKTVKLLIYFFSFNHHKSLMQIPTKQAKKKCVHVSRSRGLWQSLDETVLS